MAPNALSCDAHVTTVPWHDEHMGIRWKVIMGICRSCQVASGSDLGIIILRRW